VTFGGNSQLTRIHDSIFENCTALKSIRIPNSMIMLGHNCFNGCSGLGTVVFDEGSRMENIGRSSFANCISLKSIHIPSSVTWLDYGCFSGCTSLEFVYFDGVPRIEYIAGTAFGDCISLKSICIPSSVTMLGGGCFSGCTSLESVVFDGVPQIKRLLGIFGDCISLKSVCIPGSVTDFGWCCFDGCAKMKSVNFERNFRIKTIYPPVFGGQSALKIVNFGLAPARADYFAAADLSACPELKPTAVPEGVKEFYRGCFSGTGVSTIFIPVGMKIFLENEWKIKVDNSTSGDDFVMIRNKERRLKAFRISGREEN
jgi:hypothetical protein